MSATNSTTVDWSNWLALTDDEKRALRSRYKQVIADETNRARFNNWQRLDDAIRNPHAVLLHARHRPAA